MGGIVAAETLLSILNDNLIPPATPGPAPSTAAHANPSPPSAPSEEPSENEPLTFMFPYIQGILAFDTPYLGICPSVIAHGAETHLKTASTAYSTFSEIASVFGYGASPKSPTHTAQSGPQKLIKEAPAYMSASTTEDAAATPVWQRWGKYAMFAGAAGAVAAGGAAVYARRDQITEGWTWIGSHLEFVGCLMRGEELKTRLDKIVTLREDKGVGFADLITVLAAKPGTSQAVSGTAGMLEITSEEERTFCTLPKKERNKACFEKTLNAKAGDEMTAHMNMFHPRENVGYYAMSERAKELVAGWVDERWYLGSEGKDEKGLGLMIEDDKEGWGGIDDSKGGDGSDMVRQERKVDEEEMEDVALEGEISGDMGFGGLEQAVRVSEEEDREDVQLDGEKPVLVG